MTAFAGIVYPDVLQVNDVTDLMLNTLTHRASTKRQIVSYKNIQMGCLGDGWATNGKRDLHLAFDGWVENRMELIEAFKEAGFPIEDTSDTQLVLKAYELFGKAFLERLNGEFSLALLDQKESSLLLARDRIGKKPLYWYQDKKYFLFASELKSLLSSGLVSQTPCREAIATYLFFGYSPQDLTPVKDVNKLLPSHSLQLTPNQGVQISSYWSYSSYFEKRVNVHKSKILTTVHQLLEESIIKRMPAGGPIGSFVSGGLGSATVAYYLTRYGQGHPLKAFTSTFQGYNEDDAHAADSVCKSLSLSHESSRITPEIFLRQLPKIVWYLDEPIADPNIMATWELAHLSSGYSKSVFSGMGSDELLALHSRYTMAERNSAYVSRLMLLPRPVIQKILVPLLRFFYPDAAYNILRTLRTNPWQFEYLRHNALFNENLLQQAAPKLVHAFDPDTFLHKFHNISRIHSNVSSFLYFDVKTRLPDNFMLQYERLTRAFNLDWQTPFLDRKLVEFSAELPEPESLLEGETASYLKPLILDVFSPEFIQRPKKTRRHFLAGWMQQPEVKEVFKLLMRGTLVETGLISESWLQTQLQDPNEMEASFSQLFSILVLEVWFRLFLNRSPGTRPPELNLKEVLLQR